MDTDLIESENLVENRTIEISETTEAEDRDRRKAR
jgi:hypothetical protein